MPDIFVSYSREDQDVARRYAEGFEREGFSVWWDQALTPGEAFDQVTEKALDDAGAVVVLWSKSSVNSRWVRAEATQANANGRLMPVMIEPCRRPIMFELSHSADLSRWEGDPDDPAWQTFVAGVRRVVQRNAAADAGGSPTVARESPPTPRPSPKPKVQAPAGMPRRTALVYGASAVGLVAAGFAGGTLLRRGPKEAPVVPPSFHRLTFRRGLIRSARFGPDGQTIYYGALWDGDQCRVYSTRTDNPESRSLDLPAASVLAVSNTGDLALSLGANLDGVFTYGTLARVSVAGGAPRELVERVKFADWSPDGSGLAVIRDVDGVDRLEYPIGKVLLQPKAGEDTGLGFARVAADGKRVAYIHYGNPQSLVGRVCVIDGSGKVEVLSDEYVNIHGLAWRGEEIWYSASDDRPLFRSVFAVKSGAASRIVARLPVNVTVWDVATDGRLLIAQTDDRATMIGRRLGDANDRELTWLDASWVVDLSSDGRMVLFSETGQGVGAVPAAYLRGLDGSPAVHLGKGMPLALSPDMRWALISSEATADRPAQSIDIVPTGAGESRRLPGEGMFQSGARSGARWLPDGRRIVIRAAEPGHNSRLFLIELPKGMPQPISPEGVGSWAVSPDGSMIAATGPGPGISLYPVNGGPMRTVPQASNEERLMGWIRKGLLVTRPNDVASPRGEVYLLDVATGRQRSWANILPRDSAGILLMGTFITTPDASVSVFTWHRALSNLYIANGMA